MRRFCAVALCVLLVVVPASAADVASAYTVGSWADTATYTAIKDVVAAASQSVTDAATVHSSFMGMFAAGGIASVTDSNGYSWYPVDLGVRTYDYNTPTGSIIQMGILRVSGNRYLFDVDMQDTLNNIVYRYIYVNAEASNNPIFIAPVTGMYSFFVLGSAAQYSTLTLDGNRYNFANSVQVLGVERSVGKGGSLSISLFFEAPNDKSLHRFLIDITLWARLNSTSSGSPFAGFGGGTTRGGGAGRRYNLVSKTKADTAAGGTAAAGSALTDADVLKDFALFDEGSKTVSIPKDDGTTTTYTANTWVYNYETRTYNITTTNNTVVNITYGDDKATVTDGSNPPADYYYAASTGSGGDSGGDSGGGFWDKLLGGLADGILGFFKAIGTVLVSIITGLINLLTDLVGAIGTLIGLVGQVGLILGSFYTFLPPEVQAAVSAALIVVITFSVISVLRK